MTTENIERLVAELTELYPGARQAADGGRTLVKVPEVYLPFGCVPETTAALVAFDPHEARPRFFVRDVPKLRNGAVPRSTSAQAVGGESWHTFSFNLQWDENRHSALQFIEGQLRRFALYE